MRACIAAVGVALGLALSPAGARGNGRFPNASFVVVGPGASSDLIALRTTFGLLISRDAGAHFHWLCEDAMYLPAEVAPQTDPAIGLLSDGSIVFNIEQGIHSTATACRVDDHPEVTASTFVDLVTDPAGENLWALQDERTGVDRVFHSTRAAMRFEALGEGVAGMQLSTIEVAPSDPRRLYVAGIDDAMRRPRLYRSDDGGAHLALQPPDLSMVDDLWLSGVDPTNPDVVYLRASVGAGTWLLKSRDGGASVTRVASTTDPMLGFALSDDGRTVWVGSINDGLSRSDDGGEHFAPVQRDEVLCLRQHAGVLWRCGNWLRAGYVLSRSDDRGGSFRPVLRFDDVVGPYDCPSPSEGQRLCVERWPTQRETLVSSAMQEDARAQPMDAVATDATRRDAVTADALRDGGLDAPGADAARATPPPPASSGPCDMRPTRAQSPWNAGLFAWVMAVAAARRRRR